MKNILLCDDADLYEVVPLCEQYHCGIEMQAFYDPSVYEREPDIIAEHLHATTNIAVRSVHGCYGDLCPGSFDALIREVTRHRFELSYAAARQTGAQHLVLHHGYVPHTSPPDRWLRRCRKFWQEFLADKGDTISIHIENMLDWDPTLLIELVDSLDHPNVDVNLDFGHAHCDSKIPVLDWVLQLGKRIGYAHLHDNNGQEREGLGLGQGTIPMQEVCLALEQCAPAACWAIETNVKYLEDSIEWLKLNNFIE